MVGIFAWSILPSPLNNVFIAFRKSLPFTQCSEHRVSVDNAYATSHSFLGKSEIRGK